MHQPRRTNATVIGLYLVSALLLANLLATLWRDDSVSLLPAAFGQRQAPIAGGGGFFVMPAQLSSSNWGCYLMDVDQGTLCVYQFIPGTKQLQFVAARSFVHDRKLQDFNTTPAPHEIAELVEKQERAIRGAALREEQEQKD